MTTKENKVRDEYCTPTWLTRILPITDLDPCSNHRSTVRARESIIRENGADGLAVSWERRSIFVNPPYSDVLPWAQKLATAQSWYLLVNVDPSTKWWAAAVASNASHVFLFNRRLAFVPPPGVKTSSNSHSSCLMMNFGGRKMLPEEIFEHGDLWNIVLMKTMNVPGFL